ncbi:zinc-ribbon domain-containing protein [Bacillus cereus]|uniref:zinc-ribbon domain-containing protein n=1 Tax=Bacillus cereus TaxID=1396 RepID=UPI0009B204BD
MLAKEWHPTKNEYSFSAKTAEDVAASSSEYAWWLCPTCNNEYQARVNQRNQGTERCKICYPPTSKHKNSIKPTKKGTYNTVRNIEDQRIIFENTLRKNSNKND